MLYARVGQGHCPQCGRPITAQTREQIIARILALPAGTQFSVLAPVDPRPEGRVPGPVRRPAEAGLRPGPRRRPGRAADRRPDARPPDAARHRGRHRPAGDEGRRPRRGWPRRSSWRCKLGEGQPDRRAGRRPSRTGSQSPPRDDDRRRRRQKPSDDRRRRRQAGKRRGAAAGDMRLLRRTTPARTAA